MNNPSDKKDAQDLNTYEGIAEFYDELMTKGYYNYDEISRALHEIMSPKTQLMELGVGTGLVAELLLEHNSDYSITGIDNTEKMMSQAKERLGNRINYELQDITKLDLENKFEAAFSVGGCWYFIDNGKDHDLELCSHIDDLEASKEGLRRVVDHLESGGVLALALQAAHTNYSKKLDEELTYSQEIFKEGEIFTKRYLFTKPSGVVAEQFYRYLVLPSETAHSFFDELGCDPVGLNPTRHFFVYKKR
ncbi:MAG: class I SAM-dependent methyltransferase [Bacteriovoracaceae bacterium]|nr:class I SAM-dependent methyltransferase [Bacteriovoracaceae bacterium]